MINTDVVYKIKLVAMTKEFGGDAWAQGSNIFKRGGSGKTWTCEKLVLKNLNQIKETYYYGEIYTAELVIFRLAEIERCDINE